MLIGIDAITKVKNNCTDTTGVFVGILFGLVLGTIWYSLLTMNNLEQLLFFDDFNSNRQQCSTENKMFRCRNTRSGGIITTIDNNS